MAQQDIIINKNNYKIYEKIGMGETTGSIIQRAREATALEFVAHKRINVKNDTTKQSVLHQIKYLKQLIHPNIVKLIDQSMDKQEQYIYLFLELCQDYSLHRLVQTDKQLPVPTVKTFAEDIRDALQYIHSKQVLLNDLHAKNVLLTSNGILKIVEVENACQFKQQLLTLQKIEQSVIKCGFLHRAPETLLENGVYSIQSDIYSFGQLLYYMTFGQFAYENIKLQTNSIQEYAMYLINNEEVVTTEQLFPKDIDNLDTNKDLLEMIFKMLQPIPFKRMGWDELLKLKFLKASQQEFIIKENQQQIYFQQINEFCQNGIFGDKYKLVHFNTVSGLIQGQFDQTQLNLTFKQNNTLNKQLSNSMQLNGSDLDGMQRKTNMQLLYQQIQDSQQIIQNNLIIGQGNQQKLDQQLFNQLFLNQLPQLLNNKHQITCLLQNNLCNSTKPKKPVSNIQNLITQQQQSMQNKQYEELILNIEYIVSQHNTNNQFLESALQDYLQIIVETLEQNSQNTQYRDRLLSAVVFAIFKEQNQFISIMRKSRLNQLNFLIQFLLSEKLFIKTKAMYACFCSILQLLYKMFYQQDIQLVDIKISYQYDLQYFVEILLKTSDASFADDNSQYSKEEMMILLQQISVFYQFCINVSQLIIEQQQLINNNICGLQKQVEQLQQQNNYQQMTVLQTQINQLNQQQQQFCVQINQQSQFSTMIVVCQNIYMQLHQDAYQACIRQLTLTQQLQDISVISTQAFASLTDLKLHKFINIQEIKVEYFDFTLVSQQQNKQACVNCITALTQSIYLEQYQQLDFTHQVFVKHQQPSKNIDSFIFANKNILFQLLNQANNDYELIQTTALLLFSLLFTDQFTDTVFKNPMNIKNHKLYRFLRQDDTNDLAAKIDFIIQKAAENYQNKQLCHSVCLLINIIQIILDICSLSVKMYSIQGAYLNTKYFTKCIGCLELFNNLFKSSIIYKYLFFTNKQVQSLENVLFALANTVFDIQPNETNQYYQCVNEEFKQYFELQIELTQKYIATPFQLNIRDNLFANSGSKFKGLWYAFMSLLKCPNLQSIYQDNSQKGLILQQTFNVIRTLIPQYLKQSFEKFKESGPVGENVYLQPNIYQQKEQQFVCQIDMPGLGLTQGEGFTQEQIKVYQITLQQAILRLITSKSMFFQLFTDSNCENAFELLEYSFKIVSSIIQPQVVQEYFSLTLVFISSQQPKIQKLAYQMLENYIQYDPTYIQQLSKNNILVKSLQKIDISYKFVKCYVNFLKNAFQLKLQSSGQNLKQQQLQFINVKENRSLIVNNVEQVISIFDILIEKCSSFFQNQVYNNIDQILCLLDIILNICQLFLYNNNSLISEQLIQGLMQLITQFCDQSSNYYKKHNRHFNEKIILQMLDIIQQCGEFLKNKKTKQFEVVTQCLEQICKDNLYKYKYEQIIQGAAPLKFPYEWFDK